MTIVADDVFAWMGNNAPKPEAVVLMAKVVAGVLFKAARDYTVPTDEDPNFDLAMMMQCARIWQRKDSPGGVISNTEFGAIRVTRFDSDITDMLSGYLCFNFA